MYMGLSVWVYIVLFRLRRFMDDWLVKWVASWNQVSTACINLNYLYSIYPQRGLETLLENRYKQYSTTNSWYMHEYTGLKLNVMDK